MTQYKKQVEKLAKEYEGFAETCKKLSSLKDKSAKILYFSHHDLDGVTSATILKKIFEEYLGSEVSLKIPTGFRLEPEEVDEALKEEKYDTLIISDKGTFGYYDKFTKKFENVIIIDHHLKDGMPQDCTVFNPSAEKEVGTSTSILAHMLSTYFGIADNYDDFIALLGGRGDYVITSETDDLPDFVEPFVELVKNNFDNLFKKVKGRPTFYDTKNRESTTLLNQIAEVLHISTLSHLYSSESETVEIDQGSRFVVETLTEFVKKRKKLDFRNLDEFISALPESEQISTVFKLFKRDWSLLEDRVDNSLFVEEVKGVGLYLTFAKEAPAMEGVNFPAILPFVASSRLEDFKDKRNHKAALVIVFCPKKIGTHISMRGGGGILSCDAMCRELVRRVQKVRPRLKDNVGGGGHEMAAECVAGKEIKLYVMMKELILMLEELKKNPKEFKTS